MENYISPKLLVSFCYSNVIYSVKVLDEVVSATPAQGQELVEDTAQSIPSKVSASSTPSSSEEYRHHCSYCNTSYPASWQLEQHIQTKEHWSKVNSDEDKEHQWKQRDPPWSVVDGQYQECLE